MVIFLFLLACRSAEVKNEKQIKLFTLEPVPLIQEVQGQKILMGGFSGLILSPNSKSDSSLEFFTHTDRGPNGWISQELRPFWMPDYAPRILKIKLKNQQFEIIEEIVLKDKFGKSLTGLPNRPGLGEEVAVDLNQNRLPADLNGIDVEALTLDSRGFYWMGDEYLPAILKFNSQGELLKKWIPKGTLATKELKSLQKKYGKNYISETLPEVYRFRESNRGFEAITIHDGKLFIMLQSSLGLKNIKNSKIVRILVLDLKSELPIGEYFYELENPKHKIGDMTVSPQGLFYVLEQDGKVGEKGFKKIYKFDLKNKNILTISKSQQKNKIEPEMLTENEFNAAFQKVQKTESVDLTLTGYDFAEKIEGLAWVDDKHLAVINDNDFGLDDKIFRTDRKSILGLIEIP